MTKVQRKHFMHIIQSQGKIFQSKKNPTNHHNQKSVHHSKIAPAPFDLYVSFFKQQPFSYKKNSIINSPYDKIPTCAMPETG